MSTNKIRATRTPLTEFGQSFKGFVTAVPPTKLAIKVAAILGETDSDKMQSAISSLIRKASQRSGVVSIRRKQLVEAVVQCVVELDPFLEEKGDHILKSFQYENINNSSREPGTNWLVKLKLGEQVAMRPGPQGDGIYALQYIGPIVDEANS